MITHPNKHFVFQGDNIDYDMAFKLILHRLAF
jgi:hypothetical protein